MKQIKIFSLLLMTATTCATIAPVTQAAMLMPSLSSQMQYQTEVDKQAIEVRTVLDNQSRLAEIKRRNEARMADAIAKAHIEQLNAAAEKAATSVAPSPVLSIAPKVNSTTINSAITSRIIPTAHTASQIASTSSEVSNHRYMGNINMQEVEQAWKWWVNALRLEKWLAPYAIDSRLSNTAQDWSEFSANRGYITHGRPGDGCVGTKNFVCYNFSAIDKWFMERGVNATIVNRSKHTENVGYGAFRCSASDCTAAAIAATKKTFDFFHREKSYNGVHYRSMVNANFTHMGVGMAHKNGTYYVTIHYSTPLK